MKKTIFLTIVLSVLLSVMSVAVIAQPSNNIDKSKVDSLDNIISTLYSVISGEKGEVRDWKLFKSLFHTDAKLIFTQKNKEGSFIAKYMTPDDYINGAGKWLVANGFFEKEIQKSVNTFGTITQVFSTYESFKSAKDEIPFARGINSIQLFNDGQRWWIINIYWTSETKDNLIPSKYLP